MNPPPPPWHPGAGGEGGSRVESSVAGVKGHLREPPVELHRLLGPGHHVADPAALAARGLAVDLAGAQDPGPELGVGHLSREGLGDVKAAPHRVLGGVTLNVMTSGENNTKFSIIQMLSYF